MEKAQLIARKPAYRNGQLLLEADFTDEQAFHVEALARHARVLCGFGAVRGLDLQRDGDRALTVTPGFAVDRAGHEIELGEPMSLELAGLGTETHPVVSIGFRADPDPAAPDRNRIDCVAVVRVAGDVLADDVRLGRLQLDGNGLIGAVSQDERDRYLTLLTPGSVRAESLAPELRAGWLTMAFHPSELPWDSQDEAKKSDYQPPFRFGAVRARVYDEYPKGTKNNAGAAGTMPVVLPIGVRRIQRFRVAGPSNEKGIVAILYRGGYKDSKYVREALARIEVAGNGRPFLETVEIGEGARGFDEMSTLSVDIRSKGDCEISLVGIEVAR